MKSGYFYFLFKKYLSYFHLLPNILKAEGEALRSAPPVDTRSVPQGMGFNSSALRRLDFIF